MPSLHLGTASQETNSVLPIHNGIDKSQHSILPFNGHKRSHYKLSDHQNAQRRKPSMRFASPNVPYWYSLYSNILCHVHAYPGHPWQHDQEKGSLEKRCLSFVYSKSCRSIRQRHEQSHRLYHSRFSYNHLLKQIQFITQKINILKFIYYSLYQVQNSSQSFTSSSTCKMASHTSWMNPLQSSFPLHFGLF